MDFFTSLFFDYVEELLMNLNHKRNPFWDKEGKGLASACFPLCVCRMKKREVFQIPADMSPAETGNPATSYKGPAHYSLIGGSVAG